MIHYTEEQSKYLQIQTNLEHHTAKKLGFISICRDSVIKIYTKRKIFTYTLIVRNIFVDHNLMTKVLITQKT